MGTEPDAKAIFWEALNRRTAAERAAYLDGACREDAALRGRVEDLLRAHGDAGSFLEHPAVTPASPDAGRSGRSGAPAGPDAPGPDWSPPGSPLN